MISTYSGVSFCLAHDLNPDLKIIEFGRSCQIDGVEQNFEQG